MVKRKRKMPAHIVLPNGMWRFVKAGSKRIKLTPRKRAVKRKVKSMARRRTRRYQTSTRRRSSSRRGVSLTRGLMPVGGIIGAALIGAGAAQLQRRFLPQMIPYQGPAAGFVVGGVGGAAGAFIAEMLGGSGVQQIGGNY